MACNKAFHTWTMIVMLCGAVVVQPVAAQAQPDRPKSVA